MTKRDAWWRRRSSVILFWGFLRELPNTEGCRCVLLMRDWISCWATETNCNWLLCPTATGGSRTRWQTIAGSGQADETPSQVQDQAPLFKNIVNKRRCPVQLAKGKCVSSELHRLQSELHVLGAFATTCCSAARLPICWHHQLQIFSAVSCFFYLLHRSQLHIQLLIDSSAETFFLAIKSFNPLLIMQSSYRWLHELHLGQKQLVPNIENEMCSKSYQLIDPKVKKGQDQKKSSYICTSM